MLDAMKSEEQRRLLEVELDAVGIRLNKRKPDVVFKRRTTGGVSSLIVSPIVFLNLYFQITVRRNCVYAEVSPCNASSS
jgi:ribosome-interacting GTPase 1